MVCVYYMVSAHKVILCAILGFLGKIAEVRISSMGNATFPTLMILWYFACLQYRLFFCLLPGPQHALVYLVEGIKVRKVIRVTCVVRVYAVLRCYL